MIDHVFIMWIVGGAFLGWIGMKSYRKYKSGHKDIVSTKPDKSVDNVSE